MRLGGRGLYVAGHRGVQWRRQNAPLGRRNGGQPCRERDAFQHSHNSAHCSIMPPCQNRGLARDETGHRPSAMETLWNDLHLMNPGFQLQWGHRLSAMERGKPCGEVARPTFRFNGATAFGRWKGLKELAKNSDKLKLQWGHRLSAMERVRDAVPAKAGCTSFNGATAFRRWKVVIPTPGLGRRVPRSTLQWGHRLSAMERDLFAHLVRLQSDVASMGPPPFGDGKRVPASADLHSFAFHASMGPPPFGDGDKIFYAPADSDTE